MNCPNCALDMESNTYGVHARKKVENVTHTCSECGYSETR
jgi:C4-type Zn-finger protein